MGKPSEFGGFLVQPCGDLRHNIAIIGFDGAGLYKIER